VPLELCGHTGGTATVRTPAFDFVGPSVSTPAISTTMNVRGSVVERAEILQTAPKLTSG
jgi:hypothetical protein